MCCDAPLDFEVPPRIAEMIAEYRRLLASGYHWGGGAEVTVGLLDHVRFVPLERLVVEARSRIPHDQSGPEADDAVWLQDFDDALRRCLNGDVPRGLTLLHTGPAGRSFRDRSAACGHSRWHDQRLIARRLLTGASGGIGGRRYEHHRC